MTDPEMFQISVCGETDWDIRIQSTASRVKDYTQTYRRILVASSCKPKPSRGGSWRVTQAESTPPSILHIGRRRPRKLPDFNGFFPGAIIASSHTSSLDNV